MRAYLSALVLFFSTLVSATTLDKIVVFGDSLSDNGNLFQYMKKQFPVSPPYFQGRFSNGPVWVELLAESYFKDDTKAHLLDYAFAGASVQDDDEEPLFTLRSEVDSYLLAHQNHAVDNSLYVIWIGSNDYLAVPEDVETATQDVNNTINQSLERLVAKGAKHFLILNLPDLGRTPAAREFESEVEMSALALRHNAILKENIEKLRVKYPSVQWIDFNIEAELNDMLNNPTPNGFSNVMDTCNESSLDEPSNQSMLKIASTIKTQSPKSACDGFLFFDMVHPTALAHQILARRVGELLQASNINFVS